MTRSRGFTLIEVLVVLALIAIMLGIAVPSFTSFISNYRATGAINDLMQGITLTRSEALKRGRRVVMVPNTTAGVPNASTGAWTNGWTVFVDLNNNLAMDSTDTLVFKHGALPSSTSIAAVGAFTLPFSNANYVSFDGTGYPRLVSGAQLSGGLKLTDSVATNAPNVRTLCLANFGRPRIIKGTDANNCTTG